MSNSSSSKNLLADTDNRELARLNQSIAQLELDDQRQSCMAELLEITHRMGLEGQLEFTLLKQFAQFLDGTSR